MCLFLKSTGFKVVIGSSRKSAKLPKILTGCSLSFIDLNNVKLLNSVCGNVDYVIHLASINAQLSQKNPKLATEINGIGTFNLIQASVSNNVEYFLYFSTAHVYGSPLIGDISEVMLLKPTHPYSISHRLAEDFLLEALASNKIKGDIIRLSNTVGAPLLKENDCWMLFVNDACRQAVVGRRIIINSDPNSERDFIAMSSVHKVVGYFLDNKPDSDFPVYNLGSGDSSSLLKVAQLVARRCEVLYGYFPELIYPMTDDKPSIPLRYNVDKLTNKIKYKPGNSLTSSIDEVLKFCKLEFG